MTEKKKKKLRSAQELKLNSVSLKKRTESEKKQSVKPTRNTD